MKQFVICFLGSMVWSLGANASTEADAIMAEQKARVSVEAKAKIMEFHDVIQSNDKIAIADHVCFPLSYATKTGQKVLKNKSEFLKKYDEIFTPALKQRWAKNDWEPTWVGTKGITISDGDIWFDRNGCTVTLNNLLEIE